MSRALGLALPGLPQILKGKVLEGGFCLFLWLSILAVLVFRYDRIVQAPGGSLDDWIALGALVVAGAAAWFWSHKDGRNEGSAPAGENLGSTVPIQRGWDAFGKNRVAVIACFIVIVLYLAMLLAPFLVASGPAGPEWQGRPDPALRLLPPSPAHPLGTDPYSKDVLSQILFGARISLSLGLLAVGISVTIGAFLGAIAGYWGGRTDSMIMRLVDMVMAFPRLVLLIVIVALFEANLFVVIVALAFTQWPHTTRLVRGEILSLREREYAEAARALGFSKWRILFRHLMPNAMGPLIVVATLGIGNTIILEAGLSFLGMGVSAGTPSWGNLVNEGRVYLLKEWWVSTFPGLAIVLAVLAFNLVGDGLRDAYDPRRAGRPNP
jgi:peptide/nickel transport system permease protein